MRRLFVYARTGIYGLVCLMVLGLAYQPEVIASHCCGESDKEDEEQSEISEEVKCYVLDKEITTSEAVSKKEYRGLTFWFCCNGCPKKFNQSPKTYFKAMSNDYLRFVSVIFEDYFAIRESLADDSVKGISERASTIVTNAEILAKLKPELKEAKVKTLQKIADEITKSAQLLARVKYTCSMHPKVESNKPGNCPKCGMRLSKKEPEIKVVRASFKNLSNALIRYLKEVDHKEDESSITTYTFYCPMAKKFWLQEDKDIGNPYYGKSMLKCGKLQEEE